MFFQRKIHYDRQNVKYQNKKKQKNIRCNSQILLVEKKKKAKDLI